MLSRAALIAVQEKFVAALSILARKATEKAAQKLAEMKEKIRGRRAPEDYAHELRDAAGMSFSAHPPDLNKPLPPVPLFMRQGIDARLETARSSWYDVEDDDDEEDERQAPRSPYSLA